MEILAAVFVVSGFVSALIIAIDLRMHRQPMAIMKVVWVLTGLWGGVVALAAYYGFGRGGNVPHKPMVMHDMATMEGMAAMDGMHEMGAMKPVQSMGGKVTMNSVAQNAQVDMQSGMQMTKRPYWQSVALSTLHCGAGCTLADILGGWMLFWVAIPIAGSLLLGEAVVDYLLALWIGVWFQYAAIRAMSPSCKRGSIVVRALKSDLWSLSAWQVGMYGFMALAIFVFFPEQGLSKTSWTYWFMMQIAMMSGFLFAFPVNALLIRLGVKKAM